MTAVSDSTTGRRLQLGTRFARFSHDSRTYGFASALPLVHLAGNAALFELLARFAEPRVAGDSAAFDDPRGRRFWRALVTCGVLGDTERPDPIHLAQPDPAPQQLTLFPTNSCNLRCVYCYASSGPAAGPRMSASDALAAVDDFFANLATGTRRVNLSFHGGGEPTANITVMVAASRRFRELAERAGITSTVATISNGSFSPSVLATILAERWRVLVSFDGPRQDLQRPSASGRGSRDRVLANLRRLADAGHVLQVRTTVTGSGLPGMSELVADAAALGISAVQVEPSSPVGRGGELAGDRPDPDEFATAFLTAMRAGLSAGVAVTTSAWTATRIGTDRYCGAMGGLRALTPDGYLSACTEVTSGRDLDDPFLIGRLDPGTRELQTWPERIKGLAARRGSALPGCATCHLVHACAGGCANKARHDSGTIQARDPAHCVISRRVNNQLIADIAEGRIVPQAGWQPMTEELPATDGSGPSGRIVALVPPSHRHLWNADPRRRPIIPATGTDQPFFHLP